MSSGEALSPVIALPLPLQQRLDNWMHRRLPVDSQITLDQGRIFIVPTRLSLAMLALVALLFILGNLFQNTMAYAVSFWLLALQIVSIFYTFRNLSGVRIKPAGNPPCFAGERATFLYRISHRDGRAVNNVVLGWEDQDAAIIDVAVGEETEAHLSYTASKRGMLKPARIEIQTRYPTGLAVAWSYLSFDNETLVYPTPASAVAQISQQAADCADEQGHANTQGVANFAGVREYQSGDSLRRIHWGKYAQTGKLYSKDFEDNQLQEYWLQWSAHAGDTEQRLSALCAQVLQAHGASERYGLQLPSRNIDPDSGSAHRDACLRALALFSSGNPHA